MERTILPWVCFGPSLTVNLLEPFYKLIMCNISSYNVPYTCKNVYIALILHGYNISHFLL